MMETTISYLTELRQRFFYILLTFSLLFILLLPFNQWLLHWLFRPLEYYLMSEALIATSLVTPIFTPIKLVMYASLLLSAPVITFQLWQFIAPALYTKEKTRFKYFVLSSICLFYMGVCFAYSVVFPLIFKFITTFTPTYISLMPDAQHYLNFCLQLSLSFGVAFQTPVITVLLVYLNILSLPQLIKARPYIIVGAFTVGMLLTPPDVVSQCLLAIPLWLMYELGIIVARLMVSEKIATQKN